MQPWPDAGHSNPWVWLVGLHGGAGVSTLVHAMPRLAGDARRQLPAGGGGQSPFVVVVARNHSDGLVHAQDFARQAITGLIPASISVLGLVLVADAPVRPDSAVRQFTKVVSRAYPRAWQIPWITEWRSARPDPTAGPLPAPVTRLAQDLAQLTGCATSSQR
ncbi:DUF6668 family protein [Saccharopolyspora pogona]|uniref:DUF6668 family protein n=1 Tax=Saccharopolyspora pogona TaxID=333966 RepID=UPI00168A3F0E|nr:DUF6668 family protein [Saccharopolyspora pogona]